MRVAIVDDLKIAVEALKRVLATMPEVTVAWVAEDGVQAVARCKADPPDLVLMDLVMPRMDGAEATRRIMKESPCRILVVTATLEGNLDLVYDALGAGALDAVQGPTFVDGKVGAAEPVVRKIRTIARLGGDGGAASPAPPAAAAAVHRPSSIAPIVALGSSTGGPEALSKVLTPWSAGFRAAVVVVQHLDSAFVPGLVEWLVRQTRRDVRAIAAGDRPEAGRVGVACTNDHLVFGPDLRFRYVPEPLDASCRPSVDAFFASAAATCTRPGVAALLTGMGRDGAEGLLRLRRAGWTTFAQDEATSVVYGMPRAAKEIGAATAVVPLSELGEAIESAWRGLSASSPAAPGGRS